ncbi:MAG: type I-E CRISPR-associated endonuclease Cas1e [Thermodesulfobacteriota bacterium]
MLPTLRPLTIKERLSILFLEKGNLDVLDGSFVLLDKNGVRTHIPVGGVCCLMLEPGIRVSHAAVTLAARAGCLLVWVGEGGVRLYAAGQPGGARSDRLLYQFRLASDETARLKVVRKMYSLRFGEEAPERRSVDQLRGIEGARVRKLYDLLAKRAGVKWDGRDYDPNNWDRSNLTNRCLSSATSCLYGLTEAAILAAGYAPSVGFIHTGKPRSFVFDVADIFKFETVVPVAFRVAARPSSEPERAVRLGCRDMFRQTGLLKRIIPTIEMILAAGDLPRPEPKPDDWPVAFSDPEGLGDAGHRG